MRDVQILTFTSLYPSRARPRHGVFVESRLRRLLNKGGLQACVVAPVPWFPFEAACWGDFGRIARTPVRESRDGIEVLYPRYPSVPSLGFSVKPELMAMAGLRAARSLCREGKRFDLIDAHYLYPDGVAAASIARRLGIPFVLSARGTDVNVISKMAGPMLKIRAAINRSAGVVTVSEALKSSLISIGVDSDRITVLRNGVDFDLFWPEDRNQARSRLGLGTPSSKLALWVGNLVPEKRPLVALEVAARIAGLHIAFVGRGPERGRIEQAARTRGMRERVLIFDEVPQQELRTFYSAADVLVLSSEREGWPNVVLESVACGTPVAAFPVGGVPEILIDDSLGRVARSSEDADSLEDAIRMVLAAPASREQVRLAARRFAWEPTLEAQLALYRRVASIEAATADRLEHARAIT